METKSRKNKNRGRPAAKWVHQRVARGCRNEGFPVGSVFVILLSTKMHVVKGSSSFVLFFCRAMDPIVAMATLRRDWGRRLSALEQSAGPEKLALSLRSVREFVHKLQARLGPIEGIEEELQRLQDSSGLCMAGFTGDGVSGR